ncbi:hypothetical protein V2J09_007477 [Rumex salicifolius]
MESFLHGLYWKNSEESLVGDHEYASLITTIPLWNLDLSNAHSSNSILVTDATVGLIALAL